VRDILPLYSVEQNEDIPRLRLEETQEAITELQNFLWLDERTRAMTISFSIYNANYNTYVACNFIFQITAGGTVVPSYSFRVLKMDIWEDVVDVESALLSSVFQLDLMVYLFVIQLLVKELYNIGSIRWTYGVYWPYYTNIWNMLEIANITPFFFSMLVRISFIMDPTRVRYLNGLFTPRYLELYPIGQMYDGGHSSAVARRSSLVATTRGG
jgi:hypothetical protein